MNEREKHWADASLIADAVAKHIKNVAYVTFGGSDGCAACKDLDTGLRVAAGHVSCAEEGVAFKAAMRVAKEAAQFDLRIAISRALDDPRVRESTP